MKVTKIKNDCYPIIKFKISKSHIWTGKCWKTGIGLFLGKNFYTFYKDECDKPQPIEPKKIPEFRIRFADNKKHNEKNSNK